MIPRSGQGAVYLATVVVLVVASAIGILLVSPGGTTVPMAPESGDETVGTTEGGTRYVVHPSQLQQGCPGMDCIPSIDDPRFQDAAAADWLDADDLVIGVAVDGETRAYPLRILAAHEIVNDRVGGRPVAVTYCPLCRSGLVFDRRVGNATLSFGVSGKLLHANLVMYDRQTETYWSQLDGSAIVGPLVPRDLTILPNTLTTWGEWAEGHPDTVVLSRATGIYHASTYASNPYAGYEDQRGVGFGVEPDGRLHSKTIVYGVAVDGSARAYPAATVADADVINDVVDGVPVLVVEEPTSGGVAVFVRRVDGEPRRFRVQPDGDGNARLVDDSGTTWTTDGEAIAGPEAGRQLERLPTHGIYWFAWSEFNPGTDVYRAGESDGG